jgi:eukaryotic-like serine/threonine-protein kinase
MHSEQLDDAIAAFLQADAAGQNPSPQAWLERYPAQAAGLAAFFADRHKMEKLVAPLRAAPPEADTLAPTGQWQPPAEPSTLAPDAAPATDPPKVRYFGDYELLEEIARGGMGVVFKARQVSLNRIVALKMILTGHLAGADEVKRFRTEAEAAANLDHPHIVPIYEVGEHRGQQYFSMKLIEGGSLASQFSLAPQARRGVRDLIPLLTTVCHAVHHAHQRGILHRDLKPGNILLDKEGQPHITDFGLAKKVEGDSGMTRTGAIMGTPSYMAPEQAAAKKQLTTAVDVYALGAILYEILTGRPPFKAETPLDTLLHVMEKEAELPRTLNPDADRDLETICLNCLEKEPEKRYGSAEALAAELERWQKGEPILARPATRRERLLKWAKRKPAAAALIGISVLAVILLVGVLGVFTGLLSNSLTERTHALSLRTQALLERTNALEALGSEQAATKASLERERFSGYVHRVNGAWMAWNANDVPHARKLLAECPPELRGWEWRYVHQLCHTPVRRFPASVVRGRTGFALSGDGRRVAVIQYDHIIVWNIADGKQVARIPQDLVNTVALNHDGTQLFASLSTSIYAGGGAVGGTFSSTPDGKPAPIRQGVWVWSLPAGKETRHWAEPQKDSLAMALSPDGIRVAAVRSPSHSLRRRTLDLWNAATGEQLPTLKEYPTSIEPPRLVFSPDGKLLAESATDGNLTVWDAAKRTRLWTFSVPGAQGQRPARGRRWVQAFAFSTDSRELALVTAPITTLGTLGPPTFGPIKVTLVEASTGEETGEFSPGDVSLQDLSYQPDGRWLALGCNDGTIRLADRKDGTIFTVLRGHGGAITQVGFTPDGRQLLSCGLDGEVCVWDMRSPRQDVRRLDGLFGFMHVATDRWLATIHGTSLGVRPVVIDLHSGERRHTLNCRYALPCGWALSPDGQVLALASRNESLFTGPARTGKMRSALELFRLDTGERLCLLAEEEMLITGVAWTRDGQRILAVGLDNTLYAWDTQTGQRVESKQLPGEAAVLCPHGETALIAHKDGERFRLALHDLAANRERHRLPFRFGSIAAFSFTADAQHVALRPHNRVLKGLHGERQVPWEITSAGILMLGTVSHSFTGTKDDSAGDVLLWNLAAGTWTAHGQLGGVQSLALSPDGQRLVLRRGRQTEFWDVARWLPVFSLRSPEAKDHQAFSFSRDGRHFLGGALHQNQAESGLFIWDSGPRTGK